MQGIHRLRRRWWWGLVLLTGLAFFVSACASSPGTESARPKTNSTETTRPATKSSDTGRPDIGSVDPCTLATADEVEAVMGHKAGEPEQASMGAPTEDSIGCHWPIGKSIDLFDLWVVPAGGVNFRSTLQGAWAEGYHLEPLAGVGDEAYAVVWRGSKSVREVGHVAAVGVRRGGTAVVLNTVIVAAPYTDPKPAADLAVKVLDRLSR